MLHKTNVRLPETKSVKKTPSLSSIKPVPEIIPTFPSTRYYGSKKKLLPWIFENIKSLEFDTVLDGFGGTGSVSLLFKAMGKDVTYHDALAFNRHVAKTVLADEIAEDLQTFETFVNQVTPEKGLIHKYFQGIFYTDDENCWLDGFSKQLISSNLSKSKTSLYKYTLFQACLKKRPFNLFHRANLNIRLANVERSFGNKTTWERSFEDLMIQCYKELSKTLFRGNSSLKISSASNITRLKSGYDLVYLDPPYMSLSEKNNFDDYWKRYHFLEGLCKYTKWASLIDPESKIRAMTQPKHLLDWSRKTKFRQKLFDLVAKHKDATVVLSYVSGAYPDENEIAKYFELLFPKVSVHSKDHPHALCKNRRRELLFIGKQA